MAQEALRKMEGFVRAGGALRCSDQKDYTRSRGNDANRD